MNTRLLHKSGNCPRVIMRLTCNACKYPASKANYNNESEIPKEQLIIALNRAHSAIVDVEIVIEHLRLQEDLGL